VIEDPPDVSVIIPTHNRSGSLRRSLEALRCQTYPADRFEVVVVADGCDDDSAEVVRRFEAPFRLQVFEQPALGPAGARNAGVALASGEVFIFLDDDVEARPSLIEAHARAHERRSMRVAIGYYPATVHAGGRLFPRQLWAWWEAMFERMRQPGHRFDFRDLLSGNLSLRARLFAQAGGFDPALVCHEDYEFGVRLVNLGAEFVHLPEALGHHHQESIDLPRALERQRQEGRADLQMLDRHPEIHPLTRVAREPADLARYDRHLRALAFDRPALGDRLMGMVLRLVGLLERVRLRGRWSWWVDRLLTYWYWRGVAEGSRSRQALEQFLSRVRAHATPRAEPSLEIDLREGLTAAESLLDEVRPAGVRLRYGSMMVGEIPLQPGAEPLHGGHLRPILATRLAGPLLTALALELIDGRSEPAQLLAQGLPVRRGRFGPDPTPLARGE
jgi:glycosyltransferase involved in cell wall biosynthesis